MKFSVIVPAFNAARTIARCISSVPAEAELIVVDDGSIDRHALVREIRETRPETRVILLEENRGPGHARNAGLDAATGEWIIWLDADDELAEDAPDKIARMIVYDSIDLVSYDITPHPRKDLQFMRGTKDGILKAYLEHRMDGSVIFTAMRRSMLLEHGIRFADGLHEDVDFLFKAYLASRGHAVVSEALYVRHFSTQQVTSKITREHLRGYFRAWAEIGKCKMSAQMDLVESYRQGCVAVVATRLRETLVKSKNPHDCMMLLECMQKLASEYPLIFIKKTHEVDNTQYGMLFDEFIESFVLGMNNRSYGESVGRMKDILASSWSCHDLEHSLFLGPDQIRACCKRFFVDSEQCGDVVLLDKISADVSIDRILDAKINLIRKLNTAMPTPCDGCPHLKFRQWYGDSRLTLLSMEHHAVCNFRCAYCSEKYYGGQRPTYDVTGFVQQLIAEGQIDRHTTVVWGGGEAAISPEFRDLVPELMQIGAHQRVLTNATRPCRHGLVKDLLRSGKGSVVVSIDAGVRETFEKVRGKDKLDEVMQNVMSYAAVNPRLVTIKYILTTENCSQKEIAAFANLVAECGLTGCNFQISCDFEQEQAAQDQIEAVISMYGCLLRAGCSVVFVDDLLRQRLCSTPFRLMPKRTLSTSALIIYGAGQIAELLLLKSEQLQVEEIAFLVDSTLAGTKFHGHDILEPAAVLTSDLPIIIAASQGYPEIYHGLIASGVDPNRIVKELIL